MMRRDGRAHALQEKKRLEEALLELQRVNDGLLSAAGGDEGPPAAVHAMSAESAQLLGELRSRQRAHYCPISGLERSAGSPSVQATKDEVRLTLPHLSGISSSFAAHMLHVMTNLVQGLLSVCKKLASKTPESSRATRQKVIINCVDNIFAPAEHRCGNS